MRSSRFLIVLLGVIVLLAVARPAQADVAPPANPPGANPEPGGTTQVRMESESVLIEVLASAPADSLGRARVTARFWMRNMGTAAETLAVRYPVGADDGFGQVRRVENLSVQVNDRAVATRETTGPDPRWPDFATAPWVEFDVMFPVGEEVRITVAYDLEGSGYPPLVTFDYLLSTGAGWYDTIGQATIVLRLPYNVDLLAYDYLPPGGVVIGREVRWQYSQLEPTRENDMTFTIVMPARWQAVLQAQGDVQSAPQDGEAWGRLGKAYKQVFLLNRGYRSGDVGDELYRRALDAYRTCLRLKPDDAQWHAGYAELLAEHGYWLAWDDPVTGQAERLEAIREIHTALQLAPNDALVREIASRLVWLLEPGMVDRGNGRYDFPWLTATPPAPTSPPPTETSPAPLATPTLAAVTALPYVPPTAAPAPSKLPVCGSALWLPLAMGLVLLGARRLSR